MAPRIVSFSRVVVEEAQEGNDATAHHAHIPTKRGQVMVTPELKSAIEEPLDLQNEIAQQIADIIDQASTGPEHQESETATWCYRIPLAGVREYSFEH